MQSTSQNSLYLISKSSLSSFISENIEKKPEIPTRFLDSLYESLEFIAEKNIEDLVYEENLELNIPLYDDFINLFSISEGMNDNPTTTFVEKVLDPINLDNESSVIKHHHYSLTASALPKYAPLKKKPESLNIQELPPKPLLHLERGSKFLGKAIKSTSRSPSSNTSPFNRHHAQKSFALEKIKFIKSFHTDNAIKLS